MSRTLGLTSGCVDQPAAIRVLKELAKELVTAGQKQVDVASNLGISESQLSKLLTGARPGIGWGALLKAADTNREYARRAARYLPQRSTVTPAPEPKRYVAAEVGAEIGTRDDDFPTLLAVHERVLPTLLIEFLQSGRLAPVVDAELDALVGYVGAASGGGRKHGLTIDDIERWLKTWRSTGPRSPDDDDDPPEPRPTAEARARLPKEQSELTRRGIVIQQKPTRKR